VLQRFKKALALTIVALLPSVILFPSVKFGMWVMLFFTFLGMALMAAFFQ
jgi:hypothetical protein